MLEVRISKVYNVGMQPVVEVEFFEDDEKQKSHVRSTKKYYLDPGQTITDIKPQIKDDFDRVQKMLEDMENAAGKKGEIIDLSGVKGAKQLRKEKEEAEAEAEQVEPNSE